MPNCPYYTSHAAMRINCLRGEIPTSYQDSNVTGQMKRFCNGTYRKCWCYKYLEGAWGYEQKPVCKTSH